MQLKTFNRFLVVSIVLNFCMMCSVVLVVRLTLLQMRNYRPPFPLSDRQIYAALADSTYNFLSNFVPQVTVANDSLDSPSLLTADFSVSQIGSKAQAYIDGSWYRSGDYLKIGEDVWLIVGLSYDRQRIYCKSHNGRMAVVVPSAHRTAEQAEAQKATGRLAPIGDGTI